MKDASHRRPKVTLFCDNDVFSHQVRFVLAEKEVGTNIIHVKKSEINEDLLALNPYNTLPTLVNKSLVLYNSMIIVQYLNELLPYPPLMPDTPIMKAKSRIIIIEINETMYTLLNNIARTNDSALSRKFLMAHLKIFSFLLRDSTYILGNKLGLVDCCFAPLLWRISKLNLPIPKELKKYSEHLFSKPTFLESILLNGVNALPL